MAMRPTGARLGLCCCWLSALRAWGWLEGPGWPRAYDKRSRDPIGCTTIPECSGRNPRYRTDRGGRVGLGLLAGLAAFSERPTLKRPKYSAGLVSQKRRRGLSVRFCGNEGMRERVTPSYLGVMPARSLAQSKVEKVVRLLRSGESVRSAASGAGVSPTTVQNVKAVLDAELAKRAARPVAGKVTVQRRTR